MKPFLAATALSATLLLPSNLGATECFYCGCDEAVYAEIGECNQNCHVTLGCAATNICGTFELPGREPTILEDKIERWKFKFPLTCYSVIADPDDTYNCLASVIGESRWVWFQVDEYFGDDDGLVEVEELDTFLSHGGYVDSDSCSLVSGKEKIALYGKELPTGEWKPTHVANQSTFQEGGDWWESKEGEFKKIIHRLPDVQSPSYGEVIKCYERDSEG